MKKCLVIRYGAFGDMLCITPALKKLKEEGYHIVMNTNKRGEEVLRHCPYIDEWLMHDESIHIDDLDKHWTKIKEQVNADRVINFSESIECNVAFHPINSEYIYPKNDPERIARGNRNYYDVTEGWAGLSGCQKTPEFNFTEEEKEEAKKYIKEGRFNILWALSGSGKQKVYPWSDYVIGQVLKDYEDVQIITIGDEKSQLLESITDERITNLAGKVSMRISMVLTSMVQLVIAPDTGVLHAAGCFDTPKIGLLGHTNIENITKYFKNDYSIEANVPCSPCFKLIYDHMIQCPVDVVTKAAWCMSHGISPDKLYGRIKDVIRISKS